jgi:hypothetical protein
MSADTDFAWRRSSDAAIRARDVQSGDLRDALLAIAQAIRALSEELDRVEKLAHQHPTR